MSLLWVTDIWGQHSTLTARIERLTDVAGDCQLLDPYAGQPFAFADEQQAYDYFLCRCSKPGYVDKLEAWLECHPEPVTLLGFSAGANAIAQLLRRRSFPQVQRVLMIYGNELPLEPLPVTTHLLLCRDDAGVSDATLDWPASVQICDAGHGFMNPRSPNYDAQAADTGWRWIQSLIAG
ncbi:PEP-CTERM protein-sorting domain-containing protein [Ferrimonas sediminum]|uniref:PEP-CTERM protein-sorting domain-containing protein n=1 Tax=Ferrimonas sediminum TaxID=718193 RepID=A0A1G8KQL6_9GAMM|nr:PEP-CTERM sorting domain-containing protein [Ferrimonas sediminum]SDI45761.1 PEP-CTERM protein-sorting domain-containing protein [Ferrimonas sediminum]